MPQVTLPGWLQVITALTTLGAIGISATSMYLHLKNYRKPMDQRLIVRIQLLVPLYALSSWLALQQADWLVVLSKIMDPVREIYEAFVIYTFFTLLTNLLGGERDIIISTSGRAPMSHLWPLSQVSSLAKVDISDPYTFLAIKRGILQYTWLKPFLSLVNIVLDAYDSLKPNTIGVSSGYMWVSIIYNVSISVSLYCLALFWYVLHDDLAPYRPMPKFLCVKIIIFFSYWQGFLLSIAVYMGVIPGSQESGLARCIQNGLMCVEMLAFAVGHWYAFTYEDYATTALIGFGRLPVYYAFRDSFGVVDLVLDFKSTFWGSAYGYRQFDSIENVLEHPESRSRTARLNAGMRYRNGGKSRYWLPPSSQPSRGFMGGRANSVASSNAHQTLLGEASSSSTYGSTTAASSAMSVATSSDDDIGSPGTPTEFLTDEEVQADDELYAKARKLKYGDYNYPVITVRESEEPRYRTIIERQLASGVKTTLQDEYESFAPATDSDYEF